MGESNAAVVEVRAVKHLAAPESPFIFGRHDDNGIVGLDPNDMGISAVAGSIEWDQGRWHVVNRSLKRVLYLDDTRRGHLTRLDCQHRHAINVPRLVVLVPGAIYTHQLVVDVPASTLKRDRPTAGPTTGTLTPDACLFSERDLDVLAARYAPLLRPPPRRSPHPHTYAEAADLLGGEWTRSRVLKQLERIRARLAKKGVVFDGPHASYEMAEYLIDEGLLRPRLLDRLPPGP